MRSILVALLAWGSMAFAHGAEQSPLVAAASDLQLALREVAQAYRAKTGQAVEIVFGSSGNLATQIRQGAPFQIFMAADETYVADLARAGMTRDNGHLYALGRIALFVPKQSDWEPDENLAGLRRALEEGRIGRFAIANPSHAPYGRAAREALQHARLWGALEKHLIVGENISQATQFAASANASGGIVAYSLALSPALRQAGRYALIRQDWHAPLRQRMVLLKNAGPEATAFYAFIRGEDARAILQRNGFAMPKDPD